MAKVLTAMRALVKTEGAPSYTQIKRGDSIPDDLIAGELERLEAADAVGTKAEAQAAVAAGADATPDLELGAMDPEGLRDWLEGKGRFEGGKPPTGQDVVDQARGNPDLARRLIAAEESRDGDPRKSVVEPLGKIAAADEG